MTKNDLKYNLSKNDVLYFHHIPKTSGTSFIFILQNYFNSDSILKAQSWSELSKNMPKSFSNFRLVKGHFGYSIHQLFQKKPIYITMLRNPTDVIVSYLRMLKDQPYSRKKWNISESDTISDLILRKDIESTMNPQCLWLDFDLDVISQTNGLESKLLDNFLPENRAEFMLSELSDEEILETAKKHLLECKFFGIVERFEDSLMLLHYTFGWKPYRRSTKLNVGSNINYDEYSSDAKEELTRKTKLDSQLYEYAKNIFEKRFTEMVDVLTKNYYEKKYYNMNSTEMVYEMLEKDYEKRFLESYNRSPSINFTFDQKINGSGWHQREKNLITNKMFRWTGPETVSTIDFALLGDKDLKIQFNVVNCVEPEILESVQLDVNKISCNLNFIPTSKKKSGKFEAIIPKSVLEYHGNLCRLTFKVKHTISPKSVNPESNDTRKLGIAIDLIKIS